MIERAIGEPLGEEAFVILLLMIGDARPEYIPKIRGGHKNSCAYSTAIRQFYREYWMPEFGQHLKDAERNPAWNCFYNEFVQRYL